MNTLQELKNAVKLIDSLIDYNHPDFSFYKAKKNKLIKQIKELENEKQD